MDEAIDWVGVLSNVHGLLGIIYRIWFEKVTSKKPPPTPEFSSVNAARISPQSLMSIALGMVSHPLMLTLHPPSQQPMQFQMSYQMHRHPMKHLPKLHRISHGIAKVLLHSLKCQVLLLTLAVFA
jgi:hypothetical protein